MDKKTLYANIIIDISLEKLDRTFQYLIPEMLADQIHPAHRWRFPLEMETDICAAMWWK